MGGSVSLTKEQNQVINVRDRDVLVAASAGSGKTFVVVQRIINRVINDNIDIDKILVVTFTNAAASELKERILNGFYDALKNKDLSDEKKTHVKRQLSLINRAQISTIHSFCLSIIKSNFYMLNLDPNIKTIDENKTKLMILESIDEILEEEYEHKTEIFIKVLELFKNEENIIQNIEKIYNFSKSMVNPKKWLEDSLAKYNLNKEIKDLSEIDFGRQIISSVKEKAQLMYNELEKVCNKISGDKEFESRLDVLENMLEKIDNITKLKLYDGIYDFVHNHLDFPRLPSSKCVNEELKKEVSDIKKKTATELTNISKMIYKNTKEIILELEKMQNVTKWFVEMSIKLDEIYTNKKNSSSYIDFNDYEHLALEVLENEDICEEYKKKFEEIYIDEYQDTSYIQEVILKSISKNNRIMVGDVKQSIYSFRNAEPSLFNEKYTDYQLYNEDDLNKNPVKIILSKNFRSREVVLNSINDIFKKIMSKDVGQCDYSEQEYLLYGYGFDKETESLLKTEINIVETESSEAQDNVSEQIEEISSTQKEAYAISEKIEELINGQFKLYDAKKNKYRNIEYKDIVILLRSANKKANIYEEVLKTKNIPVFTDTSDSFYNSQETAIILSFLKILDNKYDDISLVSVMYSIIGKFTVDDLAKIREYDKKGYFYESLIKAYNDEDNKDKEIYIKIKQFLELIDNIAKYLNSFTIAETILKIYEDTGIYYSFYLEEMGKQKCANLDSLVEIARAFEKEERSSIYQFIQYIENIIERKTKCNDAPKLLGEGENVVRILTIHKSKGLEYPVVFLADSSKKYNTMDLASEILLDKNFGIGLDTFNMDLGISYANIIKQAIKEKVKDKTLSEEERLLYVAMTRAKEKLYVYGTVKNYEKFIYKLSVSDNKKLSPVVVKDCNSYLKLIMLALNAQSSNNIKVNVLSPKEEIKLIGEDNNKKIDRKVSVKEKFLQICKEKNIENRKIDLVFKKKYKYIDNVNVKRKYTVTEIKNSHAENEEGYELASNLESASFEEFKPKSIDSSISNVSYGTIIHKILENIDYSNLNVKEMENTIMNICEDKKGINVKTVINTITKYLNSEIREYIKDAVKIQKEKPFVIHDDLNDIDNLKLKEKTYIQGVIDLYVITKDSKNIIIDFKTDRVEQEKQLIERYKYQLMVYKKGIELSTNIKIDNLFIYSFYLNKLIEIK